MTSANKIYIVSSQSNSLRVAGFTFNAGATTITPNYYNKFGILLGTIN